MSQKVLMKGNEALSEAALMAGCRHYFGYPITPQNEIAAYMSKRMPQIGGVYLQAESEVAAINMVLGASAAGVRTMTTSSSPGVSLKSEGLSYLAGSDLPAVVANIQRCGPGLGGIRPSQADYFLATRSAGHGDFHMIVLAPNSIQEIIDLTYTAYDLADKYRVTSMILADGMLGQMMEPGILTDRSSEASKYEKPWALTTTKGKRERNIITSLFLEPEELEMLNLKRFERYAEIEKNEARHEEYRTDDAEVVIVAYGISARVARNAVDAAREKGMKVGLVRPITVWPFPKKPLAKLAETAKKFITVEMSMGQMIEDVQLAISCKRPVIPCNRTGGMVPDPELVLSAIERSFE